ncbi:MAG: MBL fold metallo-hydrolase [Crocinitomicaceae bacterium]|nr:MBL fold metallo-hydrolase [Crocinitomicaceae bacterium]MDG1659248.1 MBL fold metallo-hydrolase [Crocinitomicaceae bacterium]
MKIEQLYTGCLAQGAYYIESNGEVAIIDPLREVHTYIDMAENRGAKIKYIFETHFHADFVSGHVTLAERTGGEIVYGPTANPDFECTIATDNQEFKLGGVTIKVLHTPGHTMESSSYLLLNENGKEHSLFSGDTLFLGDVGRPDLAQKAASITQEELAGTLFDSLRSKIMTLPDDTIVYPGHGAGSACGKNMSKETVGSIGDQKATNYALRADMTRDEFIKEVTDGLLAPPAYFPMNVKLNKTGYKDVKEVVSKGKNPLSPEEFESAANETGAIVLDVRHQSDFSEGHIPRSIFIGIAGNFAPWVGSLIKDIEQPILLITPEGMLEETIIRLSRVGFDNVIGYLEGGINAWKDLGKEIDTVDSITPEEFASRKSDSEIFVVDVRKESEYMSEHVFNAINTPLSEINMHLAKYNDDVPSYVHCAGGYRSMIASSILKSRGVHNIVEVQGGFNAIKGTSVGISEYVCPTTL